MILTCTNCKEDFVASFDQRARFQQGRKIFMCSLSCRGRYGKTVANKQFGLNPLPLKKLARSRLRGALSRGDIKKPAFCEICHVETGVLQAHHYAGHEKALHVKWLCVPCHAQIDKNTKCRGSAHPIAKLNEIKVAEIKKKLSLGVALAKIGREYEVSKKTILNIKHERIWRHVS